VDQALADDERDHLVVEEHHLVPRLLQVVGGSAARHCARGELVRARVKAREGVNPLLVLKRDVRLVKHNGQRAV
jgi:hypothetical protein